MITVFVSVYLISALIVLGFGLYFISTDMDVFLSAAFFSFIPFINIGFAIAVIATCTHDLLRNGK